VDFCIDDPRFLFVTDGDPVCENVPIELEVTGDDGWTYAWSSGGIPVASGPGLKILSIIPQAPSVEYTVTVTTPAGCSYTKTLNLLVQVPTDLVPPTMNGVNGNGIYTIYVNAGQAISFSSHISNNSGETVIISQDHNIPSAFNSNVPPNSSNGGNVSFYWDTPYDISGSYFFTLHLLDDNACQASDTSYTFTIIVICEYCPICVAFDNRTPSNNPLPPSTQAGRCIEVGLFDEVVIGTGNSVSLQAGEYVLMGDHFDTQGGDYAVVIDPSTCATGCQDCCSDWDGFTIDTPIPNVFSPNNNGIYDAWMAHDFNNEYCAYGATSFELYIINSSGNSIWDLVEYGGQCCPFRDVNASPGNQHSDQHSSIYWDGTTNVGFNQGTLMPTDVYFYVLYLHGCGATDVYSGHIQLLEVENTEMAPNTQPVVLTNLQEPAVYGSNELLEAGLTKEELPEDRFFIYPNPSTDQVYVHAGKAVERIQVFDGNGKLLQENTEAFEAPLDLHNYAAGKYRIRVIYTDRDIKESYFIKQ